MEINLSVSLPPFIKIEVPALIDWFERALMSEDQNVLYFERKDDGVILDKIYGEPGMNRIVISCCENRFRESFYEKYNPVEYKLLDDYRNSLLDG